MCLIGNVFLIVKIMLTTYLRQGKKTIAVSLLNMVFKKSNGRQDGSSISSANIRLLLLCPWQIAVGQKPVCTRRYFIDLRECEIESLTGREARQQTNFLCCHVAVARTAQHLAGIAQTQTVDKNVVIVSCVVGHGGCNITRICFKICCQLPRGVIRVSVKAMLREMA